MEIKTKLNIGDKFYVIYHGIKKNKIKCDCCNGGGSIDIPNLNRPMSCPKCYGNGHLIEQANEEWRLYDKFCDVPVSDIEVKIQAKGRDSKTFNEPKIKYMTTIGSGNLFDENDCFATFEEAESECKVRNELTNEG